MLYVHSEFFGGAGLQAAVGWADEKVFFGPSFTCTNDMEDPPGQDEYATVGLEAHRWSDDSISG
ncbi:hypothetical protein [Amycolatopsis sp. lyj-108]|uniref:hypothetical protein n=1 Tax=Amycolatopsis sp. lyj-108 TaxID=2789286 RepID=UPI00397C2218